LIIFQLFLVEDEEYDDEDEEWIQDYEVIIYLLIFIDIKISDLFTSVDEYSSPLIQSCEILYFKESLESKNSSCKKKK